jgi:tRNA U34 5-methylaminomethyl-2-thiouridine-forming methyltransferase MnmC
LENNRELFPQLDWIDETIPISRRFDDPYYSKASGIDETRHTFINGNDLPQRLAQTRAFTIAELGFGTGLNFLATCALWDDVSSPDAQLHFISFEQYPLTSQDLQKALSRWPQLDAGSRSLVDEWQPQFEFLDTKIGNTRLTVFFSDANVRLPQLDFAADAWFLDGFSPARNPELWSLELMRHVFDRTLPGGTFATYTSAGWVRRNLQSAGFAVQRIPGHANKRQMTIGTKLL